MIINQGYGQYIDEEKYKIFIMGAEFSKEEYKNTKPAIALLLIPETKEDVKNIQLTRWRLKKNFQKLFIEIIKAAGDPENVKYIPPDEYIQRIEKDRL